MGVQKNIFGPDAESTGDPIPSVTIKILWQKAEKDAVAMGKPAGLKEADILQKLFNLKLYDFDGLNEVFQFWQALGDRSQ